MAPTKMKLRVRKEKPSAKLSQQLQPQQQPLRPETSPDSKCPICLDRFVNVASVERCLHRFCFRCIREWAKNKAECPLCKQPFRSIFHSVRAEDDFKEFKVMEDSTASATTSATAAVTMTAAAITVPHAGQNSGESTVMRTRRPRAARTRNRRSQRTQDNAPSAASMDGVPLDHATLMQRDPACLRQLLPWLRRERVMGTNPNEIRPFLLARTDHILHELVSFARSIEAMQCPPAPSYEEDSGSPSSIINISEDGEESETAIVTEDTTQDHVLPVPMATSSEISLSQSAWDDETPGPSYSTLSNPQTEDVELEENQLGGTVAATEQREHRDDVDRGEEEECMIVGYVKPMAERTPELVQLSSDSTDEEEQGNKAAATETVMKVESSVPSQEQALLSPKPYPSTSHTERAENMEKSAEQESAEKHSHHRRREHTLRRGFRKPSHSHSGSLSQTSTESSPQSGRSVKIGRSHVRSKCREPRRRGHHLLGRSPTIFPERDGSSSEDLVPTHSVPARERSFSSWDSPGHDGERKRKRRKRRKERENERSRSPHRDSRHRRGNRALWLGSSSLSSSSSDAESRREKPAGKRKYKTRHLERTAHRRSSGKPRERKRERERSPSVEIIFERRASDSHSRGRRHKKRSRKKEREQNLSPTVITIDSSDSSSEHATEPQNRNAEANSHRTRLMDDMDNDHTVDYQDRDDNERVTDLSDHTIDYQERLAEFSDRTADDQDRATEARNYINDFKHHISDQSRGTVFSDRAGEYKDAAAGVSTQMPDYKDKGTDVGATGYRHSVLKVSDQATEQREHTAHASSLTAAYKHAVTDGMSAKRENDARERSGYTAASKHRDANINDRTTDFLESLLDLEESPDDSQDSVTDIRNSSVSAALNLERCLVDVVQNIRREDVERHRAATPLSDTCLLEELEDSLMGEGQENDTVDQQEAGLVAHRDQFEAVMENHHVMRDSGVSAEMSPDV